MLNPYCYSHFYFLGGWGWFVGFLDFFLALCKINVKNIMPNLVFFFLIIMNMNDLYPVVDWTKRA